ncbi:hypothetical protein E2C01_039254 [Portunus trituberculatus]|uniref:Uncharacterized protein n=1 Tax=Portunus trituberculatus TaxID=210409 RepID=A0A5B7FGD4_PORTR|nr:hypothetical protein [Portunus trituberculatus]
MEYLTRYAASSQSQQTNYIPNVEKKEKKRVQRHGSHRDLFVGTESVDFHNKNSQTSKQRRKGIEGEGMNNSGGAEDLH